MKYLISFLLWSLLGFCQNHETDKILTYNEYLGYVKSFHPLVKSAHLAVSAAQAQLMIARGAFDPKIEVDYDTKQFKDKTYYSLLNTTFKIPTWYGIEVKAGFDNQEGMYVNPENIVPNRGLTSFGVSVPLGQGWLINQRMSDIRKSKIQIQLSQNERKLNAIAVVYEASIAYFNWKKNYSEVQLYQTYLNNAQSRFNAIKQLILQGDKPSIDSIEARIMVKNRLLSLEDSKLKLAKSKFELSNYLWYENNIPLELQEDIIPEENLEKTIHEVLKTNDLIDEKQLVENHPKINVLQKKIALLEVEQQFKKNLLLPKLDVSYYYLSEPNYWNSYNFNNYKVGMNFYVPLFLRKERGNLQLTKFKIQDTQYSLQLEKLALSNKISAQQKEIKSIEVQRNLALELVNDTKFLLEAEERLFGFGESSIFLINTRENNLVSSQLSKIILDNRFLVSTIELYKTKANME
ncbi:TolC family protein [Flavobacterium aciduliphilum]|uniref:Outer membrane protein TolC n=1 Tax=Flavobacterium aciduliphilum TaxID=1101402 RepID=A0A328Y8V6_9FLAO|nr:TolC family protein [Flavobacterium aciduliphilum]RAR70030.1 outer membrane protein TolC [Flavobacterium aciduliphilum]